MELGHPVHARHALAGVEVAGVGLVVELALESGLGAEGARRGSEDEETRRIAAVEEISFDTAIDRVRQKDVVVRLEDRGVRVLAIALIPILSAELQEAGKRRGGTAGACAD